MTEATFRYQKARIVVLEEECLRAKEAMKIAEKEKKMAVGNLSNLKSEKNKIDRKYEHCRSLYEKLKEENKKLSTSAKASEREVIKLRRELQDAIKATKKANAGTPQVLPIKVGTTVPLQYLHENVEKTDTYIQIFVKR